MTVTRKTLMSLFLIVTPEHFFATAQTVEDARQARKKEDYPTAFRILSQLANEGNAQGQFDLGLLYFNGLGVPKNDVEAVNWCRKAAEQGLAEAQASLGAIYQKALGGVLKNDVEAVKWYRKAAEQGDAYAQADLAAMYYEGLGV